MGGLIVGIEGRADYEYARELVGLDVSETQVMEREGRFWGEGGYCVVPNPQKHVRQVNMHETVLIEISHSTSS